MLQLSSSFEVLFLTCLPVCWRIQTEHRICCFRAADDRGISFTNSHHWQSSWCQTLGQISWHNWHRCTQARLLTIKHSPHLCLFWPFFFGICNFLCRSYIKEPKIMTKICVLCLSSFFLTDTSKLQRWTNPKCIYRSDNVDSTLRLCWDILPLVFRDAVLTVLPLMCWSSVDRDFHRAPLPCGSLQSVWILDVKWTKHIIF